MNVGEQIRKRRNELNMTQQDLADRLNVTRPAISNWENEKNYPDLQTIVAISDELNISLDMLLKGDRELVEKITKDTNEAPKLRSKVKKLIAAVVVLCVLGIVGIGTYIYLHQESYISYEEAGLRVTDEGDIYADNPYYGYYGVSIEEGTYYFFLSKSNLKDKVTNEKICSIDSQYGDSEVKAAYYIPEKYVKKYNMLKDKHLIFEPTQSELDEIKQPENLVWTKH